MASGRDKKLINYKLKKYILFNSYANWNNNFIFNCYNFIL